MTPSERMALIAQAKDLAIELLLQKGLYGSILVEDEVQREAERQLRDALLGTFDCYCTKCRQVTPFIVQKTALQRTGGGLRFGDELGRLPNLFALTSICQRDLSTYTYVFQKVGDQLIKIGQLPSMGDISFGELKDIDKSLEPADRKELGTALGLFSHDAAAGAFVYLRRVFERMIERAHQRHGDAPIEGFDQMRMDDKIAAINDTLPQRVVTNRRVFALLSQGVHELSDDQCKALFPVVKAVVFEMLELEEHRRRKEVKERETDAAFQAALSSGIAMLGEGGEAKAS